MAYATTTDMIALFGEPEMILLTTKTGDALDAVNTDRSDQALADASDTIDSYLRKRYAVPLTGTIPLSVARAARALARYDLAIGKDSAPSKEMRLAREEVLGWLDGLADGRLTLDGLEPSGDYSGAMTQDRMPRVGHGAFGGGVMPPAGYDPEWPSTW